MRRFLRALEVLAWFAFFAFAALVLALRYWVLPDIERYRADIVAAISREVGLPVKVGAIEAGWTGLRPTIGLRDVRIHDAQGHEALVLPAVENVVAWRSLAYGDLRLHSLVIDGPRLAVRRDAQGALYVAGIRLAERRDAAGEGRFTDWLLDQTEVVIRNAAIEWRDEKRGAPPLALSQLELRMKNADGVHSFAFSARPPAALGSGLEMRAQLFGETVMRPEAWSGRLYAELGYTDLAAWRAWVDYPIELNRGHGALRLWLNLERGALDRATADVALAGVEARLAPGLAPLELAAVRGRLQGWVRGGGYELAGRRVELAPARGEPLATSDFQLAWRKDGGRISASRLELGTLPQLVAALPLPDEARRLLAEAAPQGRLDDASFEWTGELTAMAGFALHGKFSGLAMRPVGAVPGFEGLSGRLDATESRGRLQLDAKNASLELPQLFPEPRVALDTLSGQVDWERAGSALGLRLVSVAFANPHLAGAAHGSFSRAGPGSERVDLTASLSRADGTQLERYLPRPELMGENTRRWLAGSIRAARASDVELRLRGNLREFPFREPESGIFRVSAKVHEGVLEYAPGWPRIEAIEASLLFERDRMEIAGRSGAVFGTKLSGVRVAIPKMAKGGTRVLISGQAEGATSEFLKFVASSPVAKTTGGFTDPLRATGRGKLELALELPLEDLERAKVSGEFAFAGNDLRHPDLPLLERAAGKLTFSEAGFQLHDIRARALGGDVAVKGGTQRQGPIEVVASGSATLAGVRAFFDQPWMRHLSGATSYVATVSVREAGPSVRVESPLTGVAIALPAPLGKPAAEARPLWLEIGPARPAPRESFARRTISLTLDRLAAAEIVLRAQGEKTELRRAGFWLNPQPGEAIRLPEKPGVLVHGSLAALDADAWMAALAGDGGGAGSSAPGALPGGLLSLDLKVGTLDAYGKRVRNLAVRAGAEASGWSAVVRADELAGELVWRHDNGGRLIARLDRFDMPEDVPGARAQAAREPRDVPAIDFVAERFAWRRWQLGRVEVAAQRDGADWRIDKLSMKNPDSSLAAKGLWHSGRPARSELDFTLEAADAGGFLARVGHPDLVKGGRAKLSGRLAWQGTLLGLDYPSLSGFVELHAQDGQFLEIEPGIGKLISLMSLQSLPRRITLDFRDVFSKGFQFERIDSAANVDAGVMAIKEFRMRGSAAEVRMSGGVDLAHETQNLKVRVVPSLGDSASTAVAIVNPIAGAAALLAQRVLKNPLGQIFAYDYAVTGGWADPKVAKLSPEPVPLKMPTP